jgi:hypothetical protein
MLRYSNKPPRRPKPIAKAVTKQKQSNQRLRQRDDSYIVLFSVMALAFVARLVVAASGTQAVAQVGDRLNFYPSQIPATVLNMVVTARIVDGSWSKPGVTCTLDVSKMTNPGGAMTVMAVRPDGIMLSWAGGTTANGSAGCNANSQILVTTSDYLNLLRTQTSPATLYRR